MTVIHDKPTIEKDGWVLESADERAAAAPDMFSIPTLMRRQSLQTGEAARLLFDIVTRSNGKVVDRGTDRMWVLVKSAEAGRYIGVLDNEPGASDNLNLHLGDLVAFGPEHICEVGSPPREYVVQKYGDAFFKN